ncbi:hypothetical protein HA071_25540, partial [Escherichia coli]|nr:hypothetical protein [Escherichia coli]
LIQSYVNPQCIYTDHDVIKVENVEQHTMVHFSNHASQSFDLCIGADGLHSVVRQAIHPNAKILYQGYTCFRGLVDDADLHNIDIASEYWG